MSAQGEAGPVIMARRSVSGMVFMEEIAQDRNRVGFADFYGARKDAVFRAVLVAVGDRVAAEDAVAEAFMRAYARWPWVAEHPNPTAWVLRTALNAQRSWWRRSRREVVTQPPDRVAETEEPSRLPGELKVLIARLPRRQREVVALRVLADLSAEETGALLGIAPATVHVHLHRALAALRLWLSGEQVQMREVR